jgi:pimeloyl-ACP methyl ester carboxylesterase
MRRRAIWAAAVVTFALLTGCQDGGLLPSRAQAEQRPGRLVKLPDGRVINLRCSGRGQPTVLLESGFQADSGAWHRVQPQIARQTRVCSYDRAGAGFSDPAPLPHDGAAIARDLDQALHAAGLRGPYIVVGHSAGGLYARLFAARRLKEVKGLVLLDPTTARRAPEPGAGDDGLGGIRRRVQRCLANTLADPQPPLIDPTWNGCGVSLKDPDPHALFIAQRPDTWRAQLSELDSLFGRTSDQVFRLDDLLNDIPIYVITASDTAAAAPKIGYDKPQSVLELQHERLALGSEHGSQRTVYSSHLIMIDRPEVVVSAVLAMVQAVRAGKPPDSLPPSETNDTAEQAFTPQVSVTK